MAPRKRRGAAGYGKTTTRVITDVPTLVQLARESIDKLDPKSAIVYLKEALKFEPNNWEVVDLTASMLIDLGDEEEAFKVCLLFFCVSFLTW